MFAGPNGSGKSTLKRYLSKRLMGVYLNPDELEASIRNSGRLCLADYGISESARGLYEFMLGSSWLCEEGLSEAMGGFTVDGSTLDFNSVEPNSYHASVIIDFIRRCLLDSGTTFTVETVMSHPSKVRWLEEAQQRNWRTYLYYIATDDPEICVARVRHRVASGGHDVPDNKIAERYHRSLGQLYSAIRHTNRAFIFDNSATTVEQQKWIAEVTEGRHLELKVTEVPAWFQEAVLDRVSRS